MFSFFQKKNNVSDIGWYGQHVYSLSNPNSDINETFIIEAVSFVFRASGSQVIFALPEHNNTYHKTYGRYEGIQDAGYFIQGLRNMIFRLMKY